MAGMQQCLIWDVILPNLRIERHKSTEVKHTGMQEKEKKKKGKKQNYKKEENEIASSVALRP